MLEGDAHFPQEDAQKNSFDRDIAVVLLAYAAQPGADCSRSGWTRAA